MVQLYLSAPLCSGWSETVNGLSGQLRVALEELHPGLRYAVHLELWNQSPSPLAVVDQPQIQAEVFNAAGKVLPAVGMNISGPIPAPQWGVIPSGAYLGFRIDLRIVGMPTREQGRVLLALGSRAWELPSGTYSLNVGVTFHKGPAGQQHQWAGRLELPPMAVAVSF